jgi:glycosyltransferase involved in cell wall biosynthesis
MPLINKILHITPTDVRYDGRILKELYALKSLENSEVRAFGIDDDEGHKFETQQEVEIQTFRLFSKQLKFIPRPIRYFLNLLEAMFRITVPGIRFKPSVIHCHDTLYLPIALIIKWFCKSHLIYDAHELESNKAGQSKVLSKYTLFIEKISWKHINFLISVSPSIIVWYNKHLGEKESELIMNAPILNASMEHGGKSNYLRQKFGIPDDKKIFLYLGIISQKGRGVELYLDVFKKKDINSHIVFMGYGEYTHEIKRSAEKFPNIHYHEAVPHNQVVEVSKSADVGLCMLEPVSLSDYYSLPNKLFEYAFSDLYVLASDFPDIRQLVNEFSLGICSSLKIEDVYKSIKSLENKLTDNLSIDRLYPLSWECQAEKLGNLYQRLLMK